MYNKTIEVEEYTPTQLDLDLDVEFKELIKQQKQLHPETFKLKFNDFHKKMEKHYEQEKTVIVKVNKYNKTKHLYYDEGRFNEIEEIRAELFAELDKITTIRLNRFAYHAKQNKEFYKHNRNL